VLSAQGNRLEALRHFREALVIKPDNQQAQANLLREIGALVARLTIPGF
jgi:hypothetical protein